MLPRLLRRLLWVPVTLLTVSLLTFLVLSTIPDPILARAASDAERTEVMRERDLDVPLFWNLAPRDARVRALEAWKEAGKEGPAGDAARAEIVRIGGAALPHVLPALDALAPAERARAACGLAPLVERMGLPEVEVARDPEHAARYWLRFWDDRGIEFRSAAVASAVERISRYRSDSRAEELAELDTYALEAVMEAMPTPSERTTIDEARALVGLAARATRRDDRIAEDASASEATAVVVRWRRWWEAHRLDYVTLDGPGRATAAVLETQYGRWALRAVTQKLGRAGDATVARELRRRAPLTATIVFGAVVIAYAAAMALGMIAAASRGRRLDIAIAMGVLALVALPTAVLAVGARAAGAEGIVVPTLVVAAGLLAMPTRLMRSSLISTLNRSYVRAAVARGASRSRIIALHGLKNGFLPILTQVTLEPPAALGGAFVVEHVFGLRGVGAGTIEALANRDVDWLMAIALVAAATATFGVLAADLILAAADPRVRRFFSGAS